MTPRQEARAAGAARYCGAVCPKGHDGARLTCSGQCVECHRAHNAKQRVVHRDTVLAADARRRKANPLRTAPYSAAWYAKHPGKAKKAAKEWIARNPEARRIFAAARRARARKATPCWADRKAMRLIYARCPLGQHVDHAVPLRGKLVSGLHVAENLQYLPARENQRKGNRHAE